MEAYFLKTKLLKLARYSQVPLIVTLMSENDPGEALHNVLGEVGKSSGWLIQCCASLVNRVVDQGQKALAKLRIGPAGKIVKDSCSII